VKYRYEQKYLLNALSSARLKSVFGAVLERDNSAGSAMPYTVRSLYFDDARNTDYFAKFAGLSERKKYRLRYYNGNDSFIRFEKKRKSGLRAYKRQAEVSRRQAEAMVRKEFGLFADAGSSLLREAFLYDRQHALSPAVICQYRREAFVYPVSNVRVTFDAELKTGLSSTDFFSQSMCLVPAAAAGQVILEVKYDEFLPEFIQNMLVGPDVAWLSVSKYEQCRKFIQYNSWEVLT
jgi:hypothetical protein